MQYTILDGIYQRFFYAINKLFHMIQAVGIDSVDIERFKNWNVYSIGTLQRIFCQQEIDYCLQNSSKSAERFAARFAAKEAVFKALNQAYPHKNWCLLTFLPSCQIVSTGKAPGALIDWQKLEVPPLIVLLSLTHTHATASAIAHLRDLR